jgi:hypothetical protein
MFILSSKLERIGFSAFLQLRRQWVGGCLQYTRGKSDAACSKKFESFRPSQLFMGLVKPLFIRTIFSLFLYTATKP